MKSLLLFFMFSTLTFSLAFGQLTLGVKAGANYSVFKWNDEPPNFDSRNESLQWIPGFHAGVRAAYRMNNVELTGNLLYAQKGFQDDSNTKLPATEIRLGYISFPIAVRYYFTEGLYAGVGAEVSHMVKATSYSVDPNSPFHRGPQDLLDEDWVLHDTYNRTDIGVLGEIGYQFTTVVGVQLRYIQGLSDWYQGKLQFTDVNGEPLDQDFKFKSRSLQLSLTANLMSFSNT
ncbi:MAG: PorT family protein [Chitinophagales bacterium]|nr:PorT family protein [Chitinophagales bacterium]